MTDSAREKRFNFNALKSIFGAALHPILRFWLSWTILPGIFYAGFGSVVSQVVVSPETLDKGRPRRWPLSKVLRARSWSPQRFRFSAHHEHVGGHRAPVFP